MGVLDEYKGILKVLNNKYNKNTTRRELGQNQNRTGTNLEYNYNRT